MSKFKKQLNTDKYTSHKQSRLKKEHSLAYFTYELPLEPISSTRQVYSTMTATCHSSFRRVFVFVAFY